jgi:hypothetical protein
MDLLALEPLPVLIEVGASCSAETDAVATAVAAEAGATWETLAAVPQDLAAHARPEIPVADDVAAPVADRAEAALAPEHFIDPREDETMSIVAASLADTGETTTTGSIPAGVPNPAEDEPGVPAGGAEVGGLGDGAATPILP